MSRKARLKNIAASLCGSFASRNNDLDGYWAIGKLRLFAEQYGRTTVSLDVLRSSMQPSSPEFAPVLARYYRLLAKLADLWRIELEEITAACVTPVIVGHTIPLGRADQLAGRPANAKTASGQKRRLQ